MPKRQTGSRSLRKREQLLDYARPKSIEITVEEVKPILREIVAPATDLLAVSAPEPGSVVGPAPDVDLAPVTDLAHDADLAPAVDPSAVADAPTHDPTPIPAPSPAAAVGGHPA